MPWSYRVTITTQISTLFKMSFPLNDVTVIPVICFIYVIMEVFLFARSGFAAHSSTRRKCLGFSSHPNLCSSGEELL